VTTPLPRASRRTPFRLGVFTRLVDLVAPAEIYARGLALFETAEHLGFDVAWVAQHHLHNDGGLPSPLVFLSHVAARTHRITLATGIITLPLEDPLRLAEDAAVLDALSGGRFELGFGTGGGEVIFSVFGHDLAQRNADYEQAFTTLRTALAGTPVRADAPPVFPSAPGLLPTIWEAAMSLPSSVRAGQHGSGLLLARTAPRTADNAEQPLGEVQRAYVDAYLANYPSDAPQPPRIGLSRSAYVAPTRAEALADAEPGIRRHAQRLAQRNGQSAATHDVTTEALLAATDVHIGSPEDVTASLRADPLLEMASDLILQVHPVDPAPEKTLRSIELIATQVAPALGWRPAQPANGTLVAPGARQRGGQHP
jgi:putative FMN-dependent luciferase-like monooxygenase